MKYNEVKQCNVYLEIHCIGNKKENKLSYICKFNIAPILQTSDSQFLKSLNLSLHGGVKDMEFFLHLVQSMLLVNTGSNIYPYFSPGQAALFTPSIKMEAIHFQITYYICIHRQNCGYTRCTKANYAKRWAIPITNAVWAVNGERPTLKIWGVDWWEAHKPAMCACSSERQLWPGLHQEKHGQQAEAGDSTPLLCC